MDVHLSAVFEDEADRVGDEQPEDDQAQVEPRLPAIADPVGVDPGAAQAAHARILRTRRRRGPERAGGRAGAEAAAPVVPLTGRGTSDRWPRREGRIAPRGENSNLRTLEWIVCSS